MRRHFNQIGMTLIEIMITVFIIGAMMALGASVMFPGDEAKIRDQATRLAATIKFLYNEAAIKNRYYRIIFDLDQQSYSIESSAEPFKVAIIEETSVKSSFSIKEPKGTDTEASPPAEGGFTPEEERYAIRSVKLPEGVRLKDIFVMHQKDRQTQGRVEAYFFPNGWAEPLIVNFTNENEEYFYSLKVNPLTGKAQILGQYLEGNSESIKPGVQP